MNDALLYDYLGEYRYEHGYCVRDAFAQFFGATHPICGMFPRRSSLHTIITVCQRYGLTIHYGTYSVCIDHGDPVIYCYTNADEEAGHATFCTDPRRILAANKAVNALILLEPIDVFAGER